MLTISNLTVLREEKPILQNISLSIDQGSIHALMGPNGSGKSTLAATIMGYPGYALVAGTITFDGQDLLALPLEQRARAGMFLAAQQPPTISGVQVLTFLKEAHRMLTKEELSVAAFKELAYTAFDAVKLDHSFLYRNVHEGFSGGEKKRLEIAQLLLFKPRFAILDEIDSGLDIEARRHIASLLAKLRVDTTMTLLVITHYNSMLQLLQPDHVHIMSKGKIWVSGGFELAERIELGGYDGLFV